jgi:hypothetical protein
MVTEDNLILPAINRLDPAAIDRYKRNSLAAAGGLSWESELEKLVAANLAAVSGMPGRANTRPAMPSAVQEAAIEHPSRRVGGR